MKDLKTNILAVVLLGSTFASCGRKEDVTPKEHDVEVRFLTTAVPSDYRGYLYVEENDAHGKTTIEYLTNVLVTESRTHKAMGAKRPGQEVKAVVSLLPLLSTATLPMETSIKAEIVVDGVVKKTVLVDRNTPANIVGDRASSAVIKLE